MVAVGKFVRGGPTRNIDLLMPKVRPVEDAVAPFEPETLNPYGP